MRDLDMPTLRLITLRRLLVGAPSPLVFERDTPLEIIAEARREVPNAKVVLVDRDHALCGVVGDGATSRIVFLEPEYDLDSALDALHAQHAEFVVVSLAGSLLGVLSRDELERRAA
jgi:CBS domain-containing protein